MNNRTAIASLAALAQESRLSIYRLLVEAGPTGLSVSEIGASLHVSPATLSFHLKELSHAELIAARQDGRYIYYSANYARMNALLGYLTDKCCVRDGVDCAPGCGPQAQSSCAPAQSRRARRGTVKA
jgi:ArsR family transcriptional regulator, arsenate/arsenite/antimonite-responsive transcriptional repressor